MTRIIINKYDKIVRSPLNGSWGGTPNIRMD